MPKRFLIVCSFANSLLNFRGELIKSLIYSGFEVHVVFPDIDSNSGLVGDLDKIGVRSHAIPLRRTSISPIADVVTLFHLWYLLLRVKPDFLFTYTVKPVIYGSIAAWLAGVPKRFALISGLGYAFVEDAGKRVWLNRVLEFLYLVALGRVHKIFFQNPDDELLFQSLGIINFSERKSVVVNGSGIDVSSFTVTPFPKIIQFLLIARLLGDKGVREYFEAATIVRRQYPQVRFGLVGWIDENPNAIDERELQHWIERGDVHFYGRLADVRPAIAESSIFVLPSYREGTPRTVLEAMAMGRPIITTDAPGCRQTVEDGGNGFLIPIKAIDELVIAMLKFIEKPELIARMGRLSRRIAEEKYDVFKVNEHMLREMGVK